MNVDHEQTNKVTNELIAPVITRGQKALDDTVENITMLAVKQRKDPYLNEIITKLSKQKSINPTHKEYRYTYKLVNGTLLAKYDDGEFKYVAPKAIREDIIRAKHALIHCGAKKTSQLVMTTWIFPGLKSLVKKIIKKCFRCQSFGSNAKHPETSHNPLQHLRATKPMEMIAMDVWSSGKQGSKYKYVVAAIDLFSRFAWTRCLTRATSDAISDFLIEDVFRTGVPRKIISDNAENISAGSLPHLYKAINEGFQTVNQQDGDSATKRISQLTSTAYWPMGNAPIERIFRNLGDWIRKVVTTHPEDFHIIVPVATLIYNTTDHRALDTSPAHIHFGIKPDESVPDVYNLLSIGGYASPNQYIKQKAKETREARDYALHLMNKTDGYYEQMEIQFNKHNNVKWHSFQPGDWIMVKLPDDNTQKLGLPQYAGPATILKIVGKTSAIIEYWANGVKKKRNVKHFKNFYYDPQDTEAHKLFSAPKKHDYKLNADGHLVQETEDPFPENGLREDDMSFGLNEQARIPVIIDGEEQSQEENETKDDSDEDDLDSKEVSFHQ